MASLEGMKKVAVIGRVEGSAAEERMLAHPAKSSAPIKASVIRSSGWSGG